MQSAGTATAGTARAESNNTGSQTARVPILQDIDKQQFRETLSSAVSARAYEIYESEGRPDGNDVAHWIQAESEILLPVSRVNSNDNETTVRIPVGAVSPDQLGLIVETDCAILRDPGRGLNTGSEALAPEYRVARWQSGVDPSTAEAEIADGTLNIRVRRAGNLDA